jgi:general secretion pathway protein D
MRHLQVNVIGSRIRALIAALCAVFVTQCALSESAASDYKKGKTAEERGDIIAAYQAYKAAFDLNAKEIKYRTTYERVRSLASFEYVKQGDRLLQKGNLAGALADFLRALDVDPSNELAESDTRKVQEQLENKDRRAESCAECAAGLTNAAPPPRLNIALTGPLAFHMIEDSRTIYESIGKILGINVLFDPDYASKRIQVDLQDATPYEALAVIGDISDTFYKPITHNTIFVAQNTRSKRQTLSQQAVQIFYLKNISQQNDLTDIQTALRSVLPNAKLYGIMSQNAVMMRGTPDELQLARMIIAGLDEPRPEVLVDVTVMEVSRDKMREIGLSPPTSLSVSSGSSQTLNEIGRSSSYSISMGTAAVEFLLSDSDTRILQNPRLRAVDGQKATLKLGEKLPVATGTYTLATSSTAAAAETQFQYLDVGVNVEMTPSIHSSTDVTLKLSVEVSSESGTETIDDVSEPIISQEKSDQVIRLKDGQATILAGLVKQEDDRSISGWPGLGEIPVMKYLFSTQQHDVKSDELVFLIVPHIVRAPATDRDASDPIDTGTETGVQLRAIPTTPDMQKTGSHQ